MIRPTPAPDGSTTEKLVDQLRARHAVGLAKYGTTVDRTDLSPFAWIKHLREELLDALAYLQRIEDEFHAVVKMAELAGQVLDDLEAAKAKRATDHSIQPRPTADDRGPCNPPPQG